MNPSLTHELEPELEPACPSGQQSGVCANLSPKAVIDHTELTHRSYLKPTDSCFLAQGLASIPAAWAAQG